MKKILLALLIISSAAVSLFSEGIELGDFPLGKWTDAKWEAVWEFRSNNIRILDNDGDVYYDFEGKTIENFTVKPSMSGVVLSFYCVETGKKYEFTKGVTNLDLEMEINTDTGINYKTKLPLKK
jgi:hypothetical protein